MGLYNALILFVMGSFGAYGALVFDSLGKVLLGSFSATLPSQAKKEAYEGLSTLCFVSVWVDLPTNGTV